MKRRVTVWVPPEQARLGTRHLNLNWHKPRNRVEWRKAQRHGRVVPSMSTPTWTYRPVLGG